MQTQANMPKLVALDADLLESVGYDDSTRCLYVKFRNAPTIRLGDVPRFRYQGLLAAPRKDAYYKSFIQDKFLARPS
jgi:hypothetical protein